MWLILNDSFLSIVRDKGGELLVRARRRGDIVSVFPKARIITRAGTDYQFRAVVKQADVETAMTQELRRIDYANFKDSVPDKGRHDIYLTIWSALARLAPRRPLAKRRVTEPAFDYWNTP
jgi:hypothetical protein